MVVNTASSAELTDEFLSKKRYDEASRIFLDHVHSVRQCVSALVQGNLFSEARRIVRVISLVDDVKTDRDL